jgi:putative spermidine/putrescine transport system permease protein
VATGTRRGEREGLGRRLSAFGYRHRGVKLGLSLGAPLTWFLVVYLGSLVFLLANSFWSLDVLTSEVVRDFSLENFQTLLQEPVYRTITIRTVGIAAAVTIADIVLSFPLAY